MSDNIKLAPMKFKDFTWPHNPTIYEMENSKEIVRHKFVESNFDEIEDMGSNSRIMSGRGIFFGPQAYSQWRALYLTYLDKGPGTLIHPIWSPMEVVMTKLTITHNPNPEYLEYTFEFIQHRKHSIIQNITKGNSNSGSSGGSGSGSNEGASNTDKPASITYTVKKEDTLSAIAAKYYGNASKYRDIANANKSLIKNPNEIQTGWKITIPNPTKNV